MIQHAFLNVGGVSNFNQARVATDLDVIGNLGLKKFNRRYTSSNNNRYGRS